jgi:hypothetical protein
MLPTSREACTALVHSFILEVDSTKRALSIEVPLLILSVMARVHEHIMGVVVVIQAAVIMLCLQASCTVHVPLLVVSLVARVHEDVLGVGIVVQATLIVPGLQAFHVIEEKLLVLATMAWVHEHVFVVEVVIQAATIIFRFEWSSWSWSLDFRIITIVPVLTATSTVAAWNCFTMRPLETLQP